MPRRLFSLAAVLSLVMCVAVCALWIRSYWVRDYVTWQRASHDGRLPAYAIDVCWGALTAEYRVDEVPREWTEEYTAWFFESNSHVEVGLNYAKGDPPASSRLSRWGWLIEFDAGTNELAWETRGMVGKSAANFQVRTFSRWFNVPLWPAVVVLAILPVLALRNRRRAARRAKATRCRRCGYDLRATPGRCPECGVEPAGVKPAG